MCVEGAGGPTPTPTATGVPPTPTNTPVPPTPTPTPIPGSGDVIYASSNTNGTAGGVTFNDEDVLSYDTGSGVWAMVFDGSDVGLTGDVDAFAFLPNGSVLLSIDASATLGGIAFADADIIQFFPTSLGPTTAGSFAMYFDGSDVGLTTTSEDIDALQVNTDGSLILSFIGSYTVTGASGADEDLARFVPTSLGTNTAGTWSIYFDGSDVGLTATTEDTNGIWIDSANGDIYLTMLGAFSVTGASGDGADIFVCHPITLGSATSCSFGPGLYWDGSLNGFSGEVLDAVEIVP